MLTRPVGIDRQVSDFKALLFEELAGLQHGMMLYLACDDVVAFSWFA